MPSITITFDPEWPRRPYRVLMLLADGGEVLRCAETEPEAISHVALLVSKLRPKQEPAPAVPVADPNDGAAGAGVDAEVCK